MLHFMQNIFHPVEIRRACGVTGQEGEAMLQDSIIYVDRYICFESLRADTPEAYAECAHWQNPYFNNANTILVFMHGRWSATIEGSRYTFVPGELCLLKRQSVSENVVLHIRTHIGDVRIICALKL